MICVGSPAIFSLIGNIPNLQQTGDMAQAEILIDGITISVISVAVRLWISLTQGGLND